MIKKYSKRKYDTNMYFTFAWNFEHNRYDVGKFYIWGKDIEKYRVYDYTEDQIMVDCPETKAWLKKEYDVDVDELIM